MDMIATLDGWTWAYGAVAIGLAALERLVPARQNVQPGRRRRVFSNLALGGIGWGLVRLAGPLALVAIALVAQAHGFGLVRWLALGPDSVVILACWLVLDASVWAQHLAFHKVNWLWPLHRVHHSDASMDLTTGIRFHPGEIVLSQLWKGLVVALLGAPVEAVLLFQTMLSVMALATHANITLPDWLERPLRWVLITPALHLVHHHPDPAYTDSTYGNVFSLWDRLAGTLQQRAPDTRIGLGAPAQPEDDRLASLLRQPWSHRF